MHLLNLSGWKTKRSSELTALSVATVAFESCANIVHVESTVAGSTAAVTVSLARDGIRSSYGLGLWLVAGSRVGQERTPRTTKSSTIPPTLQELNAIAASGSDE